MKRKKGSCAFSIIQKKKSFLLLLLDRMKRLSLLKRCPEKRSNYLVLTEQGQELHDRVVPALEELIAQQMAGLSSTEMAELRRLLRKLDHSLS